ncbi:MAG: tetratricopeptide repeat protein [Bacteroidetes bacterium]|nr:tetratricopeptide repeat protein [Bacteroidota bacterium]
MIKLFLLIFGLSGSVFVFSGCGSGKESQQEGPKQQVDANKALEFFIDGVTQESMGQSASAISSYQKSLLYDSTTTRAATTYYNLAKNLISEKQPALALQSGIKSVQLDSANAEYRVLLANLYFENTQYKEASWVYEKLVRDFPDNNDYLYKLAVMYQLTKNTSKALETYELYIQRFGEDFNVRMQQLMVYDARNERNKVTAVLNSMIASDPENDNLRKTLSKEYLVLGKLDSAEITLLPILTTKPNDVQTLLSLAEISYRAKDSVKTTGYLKKLIYSDEIEDEELIGVGQSYFQMAKDDSTAIGFALHLFSEMELVKKDDWRPKWFLGINSLSKGKNKEAIDRFEFVVTKKPDMVQAWQNLSIAYLQLSDFKNADTSATKGLLLHGMDFQLNYFKGFASLQLNKDSVAIVYLEKASLINPYTTEPLILLASTYDKVKQFSRSDSLYEKVLKLDPENALVLNNYAYSLSERDLRLEESRKMSAKSLLKDPKNAAYLDTYGWILFKLKDYEGAAEYIKKAIDTGDASAVVLEHLGDVYQMMGKPGEARTWWEKARAKDPTRASIIKKLEMAN